MPSWLPWWRKMNTIRNSKVNLKIKWTKYFIKLTLWPRKSATVVRYIFFNTKRSFDFRVIYYPIKVKFPWFRAIWWSAMSGLRSPPLPPYKAIWSGTTRGRFRYTVWSSWPTDRLCKAIPKAKNIAKGNQLICAKLQEYFRSFPLSAFLILKWNSLETFPSWL